MIKIHLVNRVQRFTLISAVATSAVGCSDPATNVAASSPRESPVQSALKPELAPEPQLPSTVKFLGVTCKRSADGKKDRFHRVETRTATFTCADKGDVLIHFSLSGQLHGAATTAVYLFAGALEESNACILLHEKPEPFDDEDENPRERSFYRCDDDYLMLESDDAHLRAELILPVGAGAQRSARESAAPGPQHLLTR